jgi:hypothetical protein
MPRAAVTVAATKGRAAKASVSKIRNASGSGSRNRRTISRRNLTNKGRATKKANTPWVAKRIRATKQTNRPRVTKRIRATNKAKVASRARGAKITKGTKRVRAASMAKVAEKDRAAVSKLGLFELIGICFYTQRSHCP